MIPLPYTVIRGEIEVLSSYLFRQDGIVQYKIIDVNYIYTFSLQRRLCSRISLDIEKVYEYEMYNVVLAIKYPCSSHLPPVDYFEYIYEYLLLCIMLV